MADRYWVGGTAAWDATAGTKWATTDGGAGGASVPTSSDNVFFTAASGTVVVTVNSAASCLGLNFTGFTGTLSGTSSISIFGSLTASASMSWAHSGSVTFTGTSAATINSNGKMINSSLSTDKSSGGSVSLNDALILANTLLVTSGSFTTSNYAVTAVVLSSNNSNTRTINLGSSTVTLSGSGSVIQFANATGLTLNAGTSSIVLTSVSTPNVNVASTGVAFYNLSFTGLNTTSSQVSGSNTFNNLSFVGRTTTGITNFIFSGNQTINGTLTLSAGTNATMRTFVRSDILGDARTLTCAAVTATDIDFRDITVAGAAAPVSGTRLGDCKGNSGITFPAAKTVYWNSGFTSNWAGTSPIYASWATTLGGSSSFANFPLAQDTAVFGSSSPASGGTITISSAYNIGTIDMSARTTNTMTLATGTQAPYIHGNWINGTGTTLTGTGTITFAGRGGQTITSAGKTFTFASTIDSPGGSVTLQDAFVTNRSATGAIVVQRGTFDANNYNVSLTGAASSFSSSNSNVRTLALGSGTWTIAGSAGWTTNTSTGLTVTGTGTISLTSASTKIFNGGNVQTFPTINQGGTGTLTINGNNKFAGLTDTSTGRIQFTGGTTNEFTSFTISGSLGTLLQLGSTNTTQAILIKPTAWNMGLVSTDAGNNTGLNFLSNDGTIEYLSVSYINGVVSGPPPSGLTNIYYGSDNTLQLYYGSTLINSVYYGSTKVWG